MRNFLYWLTNRLRAREISGDNGDPYLERYFLFSLFGIRAYIHRFVASDPDRGLHDHPWDRSVSLVLAGGYSEVRPGAMRRLWPGDINVIRGEDYHRILLDEGAESWTLFIHGRRTKGWGFLREGAYMPVSQNKDDYPAMGWWTTAPLGRVLRARRHTKASCNLGKPA